MLPAMGPRGPDPMFDVPPEVQLDGLFKSLLHLDPRQVKSIYVSAQAVKSHTHMFAKCPVGGGQLRLSSHEKQRVASRASALARHCCMNPQQQRRMEETLHNVLRVLDIPADARELMSENIRHVDSVADQWSREYHQNANQFDRLAGRQMNEQETRQAFRNMDRVFEHERMVNMENVWRSERTRERRMHPMDAAWSDSVNAGRWEQEYQGWKHDPTISEEEMNKMERTWEESRMQTGDAWAEEMLKDDQESRTEEAAWFSQFSTGGERDTSSMEAPGVPGATRWVSDYFDESRPQPSEQEWVDEFSTNEWEGGLGDLTRKIQSLQDPKLQNSNFMKFIDKINKKEVKFENNAVVDITANEVGDRWASEVGRRQTVQ